MIKLIAVTGLKGSGKSEYTQKNYINFCRLRHNVLIVDWNNEYSSIDKLDFSKIKKFSNNKKPSVKRVVMNDTSQEVKRLLTVLSDFKKGTLIIEDYYPQIHFENELVKMMARARTYKPDLEIVLHFCNNNNISQRVLKFVDVIRLHKTGSMDKLQMRPEFFEIAQFLVNEKSKTNQYYNVHVNMKHEKIDGDFTKEDYREACIDYLISMKSLYSYTTFNRILNN